MSFVKDMSYFDGLAELFHIFMIYQKNMVFNGKGQAENEMKHTKTSLHKKVSHFRPLKLNQNRKNGTQYESVIWFCFSIFHKRFDWKILINNKNCATTIIPQMHNRRRFVALFKIMTCVHSNQITPEKMEFFRICHKFVIEWNPRWNESENNDSNNIGDDCRNNRK